MGKNAKKAVIGTVGAVVLIGLFSTALSDENGQGGGGDGGTGVATPRVTVTVTKTVTATPKAKSSQEDGATALTRVSVETAWSRESAEERRVLCQAWHTDRYTALEAFMESASGASLDSVTVERVFDEKCG